MATPGWVAKARAVARSYWTPAGKQALGNLIGLGVCSALTQLAALGVLLILTRHLDPDQFGGYVFGLNLLSYLHALGTLSLGNVVVRDLTLHPDHADGTTTAYLALTAVASAGVGAVTILAAAVAPVSADERAMLGLIGLTCLATNLTVTPLFDAHHRQALSAVLTIPGDVAMVGGVALLAAAGRLSVVTAGLMLLLRWAFTATATWFCYTIRVRPARWAWTPGRAGELLRTAAPLLAATLLWMVPLQGGVFVARWAGGAEAAAVYGLAYQLASPGLLASVLILRILRPHVSGPYGTDRTFVAKLALFGLAALAAVWCLVALLGYVVVRVIDRPVYDESLTLLPFLLTAFAASTVTGLLDTYLLRAGRPRAVLIGYGCGAVAFLAVVAVASQSGFALTGVAVATLVAVAAICAALAACLWVLRHEPRSPAPAQQ